MNTKHLKEKILDLAIRGKLVPQDPSEGNTADLLQKIREEKSELVKQKKIKEDKNASFIIKADDGKHYEQFADGTLRDIEDEIPFQIPENWCWCRLKDVCKEISDLDHRMPKPFPNGIPYISPLDFTKDGKINLKSAKKVSLKDYEDLSKKSRPEKGDIIFPRYGTIGKIRCIDFEEPCLVSYSCATIKVNLHSMNNEYIKYVLNSPLIQIDEIQKYINETTQANVGLQSIKDFKFPLPPLSEQKRIVSVIEKAFEQIDIIEKNKLNLKTYIKQTKSKVLDLAIHGKLVEQNPQEGNAADLLQKIREEKTSHGLDFANAKSRKNKQQPEMALVVSNPCDISDNEIPFQIPENWCWCRGKSVLLPMTSRLPSGDEFKYIDIETVDNKLHKVHHPKIIKTENAPSRASRETLVGDTVFSMVRPYLTNIALITEDLSDCIASTGFYICRPNKALNSVYLYYLMISDYVVNGLNQFMKGDNSPSINGDDITEFYYPLPPLSEQKRIVAKIEQVFEQLDVLEKSVGE